MHVEVPREVFSNIKRTSGSVQLVAISMIAFISIATLRLEHRGGKSKVTPLEARYGPEGG
jgi:hypothetical protein